MAHIITKFIFIIVIIISFLFLDCNRLSNKKKVLKNKIYNHLNRIQ